MSDVNLRKIQRLLTDENFDDYQCVVNTYTLKQDYDFVSIRLFKINYKIGEIQHIKVDLIVLDGFVYGDFFTNLKRKPVAVWHFVPFEGNGKLATKISKQLKAIIRQYDYAS